MLSVGKAFLASLLLASTTSDAARMVVATAFVRESGRKPSNSNPGTDWMYLSRRSAGRLALPVSKASSSQSEKRADMRRTCSAASRPLSEGLFMVSTRCVSPILAARVRMGKHPRPY